jgi:hypothetical protein
VFVAADICQELKEGILKSRREVHGKITGRIVDNAVWWTPAVSLLDQQTIDCHLKDMRIMGSSGSSTGLDFDGDDRIPLLNKIIWFAGKTQPGIIKWFLDRPPGTGISIYDPSTRQTGKLALASRNKK